MTKKILSGVLAAVSALTMSVSAFAASANEKAVTKPGEIEYDVPVTSPSVVLNLVMPAKMTAALNPYGAEIKLDTAGTKTSKLGVVSPAYDIVNKSQDYGIYIDATAITTIETSDKEKWTVAAEAADTDGTKGAALALVGAADLEAFSALTVPTDDAAASKTKPCGALLMDSTVQADKATGVVAGQTSQKKLFYVAAATGDATPGKIAIGFVGKLAASTDDSEVEWTEDDAINVNLVLKVTAGPKTLA